jgi:CheY-like chemotaxis protein
MKFTSEGGKIAVNLSLVNQSLSSGSAINNDVISSNRISNLSHHVQLQVKDTGIGIKAEFLPHVFDRFRQADSTNTRSYKGLGLGLAIARYLVEQQGGTIQADSLGEGQGATFTVKLPLLSPNEDSHDPIASRLDVSPELRLNGLSVLVIDDEADTRIWLAAVFEMQGAQVITAGSVDEAVAELDHFSPDLVVSDIAMPDKDGYALMGELKQHERRSRKAIPAIALTAHASLQDIEKALTAGFRQHLAKPIRAEALIAVAVRLLEQRKPLRGNQP